VSGGAAEFVGMVACVTGGARGIGRGVAHALVAEGAKVVLADRDADAVEATAREFPDGTAAPVVVDITTAAGARVMVDCALERFGGINVLVNCAGITTKAPFLELPEEDWDAVLAVDLKGPFLCTQAAAREMLKRGGGAVVNITSIAAEQGNPLAVHYAAAKGGLKMLTTATALALSRYGIRVNAVGPGLVETPLTSSRLADEEIRAHSLERIPLGRFGRVEEIVEAVLFLASERASYITGASLYVDGGWTKALYGASYEDIQLARLSGGRR